MKISNFVAFLLMLLVASGAYSQNVGGEWYGVGKVKKAGDYNSYLSEMILRQKGNKVTGEFNYFYRSAEIRTKITGTYNPRYKVLELNSRPILNFLAKNENGADCPMEGSFTLKITKNQATLTGQFNPIYEYRIICPAIDIKFTKAVPEMYRNEPKPSEDKDEDVEVETPTPTVKIPPVTKTDTVKKAIVASKVLTPIKKDTTVKQPLGKPDSLKNRTVIVRPPIIHKRLSEEQKISLALERRVFEESPIIDVDADTLKISLYDNGEVDNDTISLFYNRKIVSTGQQLNDKGLSLALPLDTKVNELSMFAENLGKIPPNTALAIIYAGEQRFELILTSTLVKNATIRFRKKVKHFDPKNIN